MKAKWLAILKIYQADSEPWKLSWTSRAPFSISSGQISSLNTYC